MPSDVSGFAGIAIAHRLDRLKVLGWKVDASEFDDLSHAALEDGDEASSWAYADVADNLRLVEANPGTPRAYIKLCIAYNNARFHQSAFAAFCACIVISTTKDQQTPSPSRAFFKYIYRAPQEIHRFILNWLTSTILGIEIHNESEENKTTWLNIATELIYNIQDGVVSIELSRTLQAAVNPRLAMRDLLKNLDKLLDSLPEQKRNALEVQLLSVFKVAGFLVSEVKVETAVTEGHPTRRKMSAEAKILTSKLPPTLKPKRERRKPVEAPEVIKEAYRIMSQYDRDRRKGAIYTENEMRTVRAARTLLRRHQRNQTNMTP